MAKKKKQEEEKVKSDPSVVLFLSLMIIMLAFFIMLNTMSQQTAEKTQMAVETLFKTFGPGPKIEGNIPGDRVSPGNKPGKYVVAIREKDRMDFLVGEQGMLGEIEVQIVGLDKKIALSGDLAFAAGSDELTTPSLKVLDFLAENVGPLGNRLRIEAHASESPDELVQPHIRDYRHLTNRRARSVAHALIERGISVDRLMAGGYGADRPVKPNESAMGRALNRRVEVVVLNGANVTFWESPPIQSDFSIDSIRSLWQGQ